MKGTGLRKTGKNISITFSRYVVGTIVGMITGILLARILGPEGKGLYALGLLLPLLIVKFIDMGFPSATVYFVSRKDYSVEVAIFNNILVGAGISILAMMIGLITVYFTSGSYLGSVPLKILILGIFSIPVIILLNFTICIFQALSNFKVYNALLLIPKIAGVMFVIVFLWLLKGYVRTAIMISIVSQLISLIVAVVFLKKYMKTKEKKLNMNYIRACLKYGWKAHLSNIFSFLNYRLDMFLINWFLNPAAVGIYSVSVNMAERLWMLSGASGAVIFPRLSELKDDDEKKNEITPLIARSMLWLPFLVSIPIFILCPPVIRILLGVKFMEASLILRILLPGIVLASMSRILSNDIAARGKPEINLYVTIVQVITNIIVNIILIPKTGIAGAAIATTISYSLGAFLKVIIYSSISGVKWYKTILLTVDDLKLLGEYLKIVKSSIGRRFSRKGD